MSSTKTKVTCPPGWTPDCTCDGWDRYVYLEPNQNCHQHGYPDPKVCAYCGQFKAIDAPCKRCGYGAQP